MGGEGKGSIVHGKQALGEGGGIINQGSRSNLITIHLQAEQRLVGYTGYKDRALSGRQHSSTITTLCTTLKQAL